MLKIEYVDINSIRPYENNAKEHPIEQIEQIKKSIQEFGNNDPIAVWHNEIVEGHGRYEALKQLGETSIPIIRLDDLTDEQRKAYTLVHNKLTMNSDFDFEMLTEELDSIIDINMEDFGFSEHTIDWDSVEEINKDNYEKPESDKLRCPLCGGIDEKIRFVKVSDKE
jgi:ParB-like chromosome segregation protein Spo0J